MVLYVGACAFCAAPAFFIRRAPVFPHAGTHSQSQVPQSWRSVCSSVPSSAAHRVGFLGQRYREKLPGLAARIQYEFTFFGMALLLSIAFSWRLCYFLGIKLIGVIAMALITCKICGASISSSASACPKCGSSVFHAVSEKRSFISDKKDLSYDFLIFSAVIGAVCFGFSLYLMAQFASNDSRFILPYYALLFAAAVAANFGAICWESFIFPCISLGCYLLAILLSPFFKIIFAVPAFLPFCILTAAFFLMVSERKSKKPR